MVFAHSLRELVDQGLARTSKPLMVAIMQLDAFGCCILGHLDRDILFRRLVPSKFDNQLDLADELVKFIRKRKGHKRWRLLTYILAEEKLDEPHFFSLDLRFADDYLLDSLKKKDFFGILVLLETCVGLYSDRPKIHTLNLV